MKILQVYVFILAAFTGVVVIARVPQLLRAPLMAVTSAISGVSLVGSLIMAGAEHGRLATILGFIAVVCATTSIVGGFFIVDRMLRMFQRTGNEADSGERRQAVGRRTFDLTS